MNYFIAGAAALMGLTSAVHIFAGTGEIMSPIVAADVLDPAIRAIAMVVWHMVSLVLVLSTLAIGYLAVRSNSALGSFVVASQFGFALIFLYYNITQFGALFVLPQWTVFVLCPVLMLVPRFKAA